MHILLIDNYDSFTYNLYDYVSQLGNSCSVFRNDEISIHELRNLGFDAIIISPGPKTPEYAGITLQVIDEFHSSHPILGICLGHQAIGVYFGAKLIKAQTPMHGLTSMIYCKEDPLFENIPERFEVMRYHSLILEQIAETKLKILAETKNREPMIIKHPYINCTGFQFHPESILTPVGLQLLRNWCHLCE